MAIQTYTETCSQMTQPTESSVKQLVSISTQTDHVATDVNEQTNLPLLVYEDCMDNAEKLMFYTGILTEIPLMQFLMN